LDICRPQPAETVLISGAAGAVGSLVGQIARIKRCRAIGITGTDEKVKYLTADLGFDGACNYRDTEDYDGKLRELCPNGVDVYFDNVGGPVSDAVLANLNFYARVALCGSISQYNTAEPGPRLMGTFVGKRVTARGFIVWDFNAKYGPALRQMGEWIRSGRLKFREDIVEGIDKAPRAFIGLLRGENFGKMQVKLGPDPGAR